MKIKHAIFILISLIMFFHCASQNTMQKKKHEEMLIEEFDKIFHKIEKARLQSLMQLKMIHTIKNNTLQKEKERLSKKLGKDHPRIKQIDDHLKQNANFVKALNVETKLANITVPEFDAKTWLVHGRVVEETFLGISGLTVSFFNKNNHWIKSLGSACTDETGYFALVIKPERSVSEKLFLTVTNHDQKILYQEETPLYIKPGEIECRNIILIHPKLRGIPPILHGAKADITAFLLDGWIVDGRVSDQYGKGIRGLVVTLYDKDLLFDDLLGLTITDEDGRFEFMYQEEDYQELFERSPDIYLKVMDKHGKELHSTRKSIRFKAGKKETINITIKRKRR